MTAMRVGVDGAVYQLATADPKTLTGTINYAEPFLKAQGVEPVELV